MKHRHLRWRADLGGADTGPGGLLPLPVGDRVRVDFGSIVSDWPTILDQGAAATGPLESVGGVMTDISVDQDGFFGVQIGGNPTNDLGWPTEVSLDTVWVGATEGHAVAVGLVATVTLSGVAPGRYDLTLFASREGDDEGIGRQTRYAVGGRSVDLEVSDNTGTLATLSAVEPDASGDIVIEVAVSPDGTGRYAYLGAVLLDRVP